MRAQRLDDLVADRHHRIERELRVLQHHRDAPAAQLAPLPGRAAEEIDAVELKALRGDASFRGGEAEDRAARLRFARAGFADDAEALAPERERHAAHRLRGPAIRGWETRREVPRPRAAVSRPRSLDRLRVERVAQAVAQQVEAEADDEDRRARARPRPTIGRARKAGRWRSSRPIRASAAARRGRGSRGRRRSG